MKKTDIKVMVWLWRYRYKKANKQQKGWILDEVEEVTGYHRKSAIRLMKGGKKKRTGRPRGRPEEYGHQVAKAARVLYQASGYISARRLEPFVPELTDRLIALGAIEMSPETETLLKRASRTTLDRMLKTARLKLRRRARTIRRPGALLKKHIPIRRSGEWTEDRPGFLEIDTVAHCGESAKGFHLWTLTAVDVYSGWVELEAVWGRGEEQVIAALRQIIRRLPVPVLGIDSDNGSEFINHGLVQYCYDAHILFTRGREKRKNDSAHVEQKNGAVVRRVAGYSRYASAAAHRQLRQVYGLVRLQTNFFQPVQKLRHGFVQGEPGAHDEAMTPYKRLVTSGAMSSARRAAMEKLYLATNPLALNKTIYKETERLLGLAARADLFLDGTVSRAE